MLSSQPERYVRVTPFLEREDEIRAPDLSVMRRSRASAALILTSALASFSEVETSETNETKKDRAPRPDAPCPSPEPGDNRRPAPAGRIEWTVRGNG